jgi:hypothetical protein
MENLTNGQAPAANSRHAIIAGFLSLYSIFHEEILSLAEKTRFAFPQRRVAANR